MTKKVKTVAAGLVVLLVSSSQVGSASAGTFDDFDPSLTYGSVEAIPNPDVVDTRPLRGQSLAVREAFVERVLACGYVDRVIDVLTDTGAITTIDDDNSAFDVGAGGFAGSTTASVWYTVVDSGPDAASESDIEVLTNSLGYVFSQGSAFLLDADDPTSFDFPANHVVLIFDEPPTIDESAALFETVGAIDDELFSTEHEWLHAVRTGLLVTAVGRARPSVHRRLRGGCPAQSGVEYTPIVNGTPSLYEGGRRFRGTTGRANRTASPTSGRIPATSHDELEQIRAAHLRLIDHAQRVIPHLGVATPAPRRACSSRSATCPAASERRHGALDRPRPCRRILSAHGRGRWRMSVRAIGRDEVLGTASQSGDLARGT